MKSFKITFLFVAFIGLSLFLESVETNEDVKQIMTSGIIQNDQIKNGSSSDNATEATSQNSDKDLLNFVMVGGAVICSLFLIVLFSMTKSNKIISKQNKKLSQQQHQLELARGDLESALSQEKEIRSKLENTHHNLKSAQSQLIHAEKMSGLGMLTAGIAHEINNPVGFIKGGMQTLKLAIQDLYDTIDGYESIDTSADTLKEDINAYREESTEFLVETKEMVTQLFKDVLFGTERVTEIVNGLRVFSRHDEAKIKSANVSENIDAALMILKHKYKNKAEIIKNLDPNVGSIDCFPGQLNQVFVNLVGNAVDAFKDCGTIIISTQDLGDKIQISFKDNGVGIPDEIKDKIFDPFFSTKDVGEGTGLGLSITHSIIEQHNGEIEVFSQVGVGTEFRLTLLKALDKEEDTDITLDNKTEEIVAAGA